MTHSPEPWKLITWEENLAYSYESPKVKEMGWIRSADSEEVCSEGKFPDDNYPPSIEDMRRIVACVNACRGIPDEELESLILQSLKGKKYSVTAGDWLKQALEMRE